jgi:predicted nucleotide-binding protein
MTTQSLTSNQVRVLQVIWDLTVDFLRRPVFAEVDWAIDREGIGDAQTLLIELPAGYIYGINPAMSVDISNGQEIGLTVLGTQVCSEAKPAFDKEMRLATMPRETLHLFLDAIRLAVKKADEWVPSRENRLGEMPTISSDEVQNVGGPALSARIRADRSLLVLTGLLLAAEPWGYNYFAGGEGSETWTVGLDRRRTRAFRGITSIDDYLKRIEESQRPPTQETAAIQETPRRQFNLYEPAKVWRALRDVADEFSPLDRAIRATTGDLEVRGMFSSGQSIIQAFELASDFGFEWVENEDRFQRKTLTQQTSVAEDEPNARTVFVVSGRDSAASHAVFNVLELMGLTPIHWETAVNETRTGSPYIGQVLETGFRIAKAVVVLFTPDDEVRLHADLLAEDDNESESEVRMQPRPNVLLEAGMALATHPNRTIIVEAGNLKGATDLDGRHTLRLNREGIVISLAKRLENAGCDVTFSPSLQDDSTLRTLTAHKRKPTPGK